MLRVFKYPLGPNLGTRRITIPQGAKIISAGMQHHQYVLWALVNPDFVHHERLFLVVATGDAVPHSAQHLHTFQDGELVWHIFEVP